MKPESISASLRLLVLAVVVVVASAAQAQTFSVIHSFTGGSDGGNPLAGAWTYNSLYVFTGGSDGPYSHSNLVFDKSGNLYGTTNQGGANQHGVVFKIQP